MQSLLVRSAPQQRFVRPSSVAVSTAASIRWCATSSASSSTSSTASTGAAASSPPVYDHSKLVQRYEKWLLDQHVDLSKIDITKMNEKSGRGLYAKKRILSGEIVVSVPMHNLAASASSLLTYSPTVKAAEPPQLDAVKRAMLVRGMRDPVLFTLMQTALCVAAERSNPDSFFTPYFDALPHPAIADAEVMSLYKDVLAAPDILEWGEQRQEFGIVCRRMHEAWQKQRPERCPPPVILDWAWRTVLARQHMLPDRGLTPQSVSDSTLNYNAYNTLTTLDGMTLKGKFKKMVRRVTARLPEALRMGPADDSAVGGDGSAYRLMPTLMPVLDQLGHLPNSNVAVEVCPRDDNGSCAELQAIRDIQPGEEIGLSFSRAHSAAFTLYRFGFLPV